VDSPSRSEEPSRTSATRRRAGASSAREEASAPGGEDDAPRSEEEGKARLATKGGNARVRGTAVEEDGTPRRSVESVAGFYFPLSWVVSKA
jgi:hypothetical protein